jgi:nitroimidazol reductase NimA-like FMN-containing flavoprotein (pyridoxamine 5'-phosphate oxidase superfamily)
MNSQAPSPRTEVRRKPDRARYDAPTIHAIVDAALLCHIGFSDVAGTHCLPMACWREGEHLYIHGAKSSRLIDALLAADCSVCITHLDGLVMARAAKYHSMNYRSAVIYGRFTDVVEESAKAAAMAAFIEHVSPGRNAGIRPSSPAELASTRVLRLPLAEAVAKVRTGGPQDRPEDLALPVWAGVLPLGLHAGAARAEDDSRDRVAPRLSPALLATAR